MPPRSNAARRFAHARNIKVIGPDKKEHLVRIRMFPKSSRPQQRQIKLIKRAGLLPWLEEASSLIERYARENISKKEFRTLAEQALIKITPNLRHITHNPEAVENYLRQWLDEPIILVDSFRGGQISFRHLEEQVNRKARTICTALSRIIVITNQPLTKPKQ